LIITGIVLVWILAFAAVFTLGALLPAWPRRLELPWSSFDDFAVTPDGKILVYTSFFSRLLVYDREGDFLVSPFLVCARAACIELPCGRPGTNLCLCEELLASDKHRRLLA
jgi:hypothetical protein